MSLIAHASVRVYPAMRLGATVRLLVDAPRLLGPTAERAAEGASMTGRLKLTKELQARIRAERRALGLKPAEWAPSGIGDRNPYPPGCQGYAQGEKARRLRDRLRQDAERWIGEKSRV